MVGGPLAALRGLAPASAVRGPRLIQPLPSIRVDIGYQLIPVGILPSLLRVVVILNAVLHSLPDAFFFGVWIKIALRNRLIQLHVRICVWLESARL